MQSLKSKKIRHLIWMLPVLMCVLIFCYSAQPGETSGETSSNITKRVVSGYSMLLHQELDEAEILEMTSRLDFYVRKAAHMTEYAILAVTILFSFLVSYRLTKTEGVITAVFVSLYAASDEFHQLFVQGRAGQFRDVIIDTCGSVIGIFLFFLIMRRRAAVQR